MPQDPNAVSDTPGPFSEMLAPPVYEPTKPIAPISGFMGTGGKIAMLGSSFLDGLQKGRQHAFAVSEQKRHDQLTAVTQAMKAVEGAPVNDQIKAQQMMALQKMMGQMILADHSLDGKKGKGEQQQEGPGHHVLTALKGIVSNALGPGSEKQKFDPEELKGQLADVYAKIANPDNSVQSQTTKIDGAVGSAYDAAMKHANNGKPLTWSQIQQDPGLRDVINKGIAANGGKPTPGISGIIDSAQALEKEQADLAKEQAKDTAAGNREDARDRNRLAIEGAREEAAAKKQQAADASRLLVEQSREDARARLDAPLRRAQVAKDYAEANLAQLKAKAAKNELDGSGGILTSALLNKIENTPPNAQGKHPEALEGVDPRISRLVKMLTDYKFPANSYALRAAGKGKDPAFLQALELATAYDPSFDAKEYGKRVKVQDSFNSGKDAQNITSLNTAVRHLKSLKDSTDALHNRPSPMWNTIANAAETAQGKAAQKNFQANADAVYNELASVFKGTGATNQEIKTWRDTMTSSDSPEQFQGQFNKFFELMGGRIGALSDKYQQGMGRQKDFHVLSPSSRQILQGMGVNVDELDPAEKGAGTPGTETPPQGKAAAAGQSAPPGAAQQASPPANGAPKTAEDFLKKFSTQN